MSEHDEDFNSGYSSDDTQTVTPAMEVVAEPEAPVEEIKYAQIPESEFVQIKNKLAEFDQLKAEQAKKFDQAFGTLGGLKQSLESFRNQSSGQIEISPEDFEELRSNYPEVADDQIKGLQRVLGKLKGGAPNPVDIDRMVQEKMTPEIEKISKSFQSKLVEIQLETAHSDWLEVVRKDEFKDWMTKEGLEDSDNPKVVVGYISRFKDATKPPPKVEEKPPSSRQQRFAAAVNPKGTGATPKPNKTDMDDFLSGYSD